MGNSYQAWVAFFETPLGLIIAEKGLIGLLIVVAGFVVNLSLEKFKSIQARRLEMEKLLLPRLFEIQNSVSAIDDLMNTFEEKMDQIDLNFTNFLFDLEVNLERVTLPKNVNLNAQLDIMEISIENGYRVEHIVVMLAADNGIEYNRSSINENDSYAIRQILGRVFSENPKLDDRDYFNYLQMISENDVIYKGAIANLKEAYISKVGDLFSETIHPVIIYAGDKDSLFERIYESGFFYFYNKMRNFNDLRQSRQIKNSKKIQITPQLGRFRRICDSAIFLRHLIADRICVVVFKLLFNSKRFSVFIGHDSIITYIQQVQSVSWKEVRSGILESIKSGVTYTLLKRL